MMSILEESVFVVISTHGAFTDRYFKFPEEYNKVSISKINAVVPSVCNYTEDMIVLKTISTIQQYFRDVKKVTNYVTDLQDTLLSSDDICKTALELKKINRKSLKSFRKKNFIVKNNKEIELTKYCKNVQSSYKQNTLTNKISTTSGKNMTDEKIQNVAGIMDKCYQYDETEGLFEENKIHFIWKNKNYCSIDSDFFQQVANKRFEKGEGRVVFLSEILSELVGKREYKNVIIVDLACSVSSKSNVNPSTTQEKIDDVDYVYLGGLSKRKRKSTGNPRRIKKKLRTRRKQFVSKSVINANKKRSK
jgi:hypothetical protein